MSNNNDDDVKGGVSPDRGPPSLSTGPVPSSTDQPGEGMPGLESEADTIRSLRAQLTESTRQAVAMEERLRQYKTRSLSSQRTNVTFGNVQDESIWPQTDPATPLPAGVSGTGVQTPADMLSAISKRDRTSEEESKDYPEDETQKAAAPLQRPQSTADTRSRRWQDMDVEDLHELRKYFFDDIRNEVYDECYRKAYQEAYKEAVANLQAQFDLRIEDLERDIERRRRANIPESAEERRLKEIEKITNYTDKMVAMGIVHQDVAELKLLEQRAHESLSPGTTVKVPRRDTIFLAQAQAAIDGQSRDRSGATDNASRSSYPARKLSHNILRGPINFAQIKSLLSKAMMHDHTLGATNKTKPFTFLSDEAKGDLVKRYNEVIGQRDLCRQLHIEPCSSGEMTLEIADFLEHPVSADFAVIALAPKDTYAYEKAILASFEQINKDNNFSWDAISQGRPEDSSKVLDILLKKFELVKEMVDVYPQYGVEKVAGKRVQNSISISVKGDSKAGHLGLYGLVMSGPGFDSYPVSDDKERTTNRRLEDATLRQTIENYLLKTKGAETKAQSEDLAYQLGRLIAFVRAWIVKRRSNADLDDKLHKSVLSRGRPRTPQRDRAETEGIQRRSEEAQYSNRSNRDTRSRSSPPRQDSTRSGREYRYPQEEEKKRLRALVQLHNRIQEGDVSEDEDITPSDDRDSEGEAQRYSNDERSPPVFSEDEEYFRGNGNLPQPVEQNHRRRDLANLRPSSGDSRGDTRQQQGTKTSDVRRDGPRPSQRDNNGQDMPRYDNRNTQNPDARVYDVRTRTPMSRDRATYLKGQACDSYMSGKCPHTDATCIYSHDREICKAKFEAMRRHMDPGPNPPSALKQMGGGMPNAAQQAVNAMWAEVDERLRRVELAALAPRQQQQKKQPIQLSAAQRWEKGMIRPAAYSDEEYEGSLVDNSDCSSGTEA